LDRNKTKFLRAVEHWFRAMKRESRKTCHKTVCERAKYKCEYPFCSRRNIEVHHKIKRSQGGEDTEENLIVLCNEHHVNVHNSPRMFWACYEKLNKIKENRNGKRQEQG
jgi:hypothetical protein